MTPHTTDSGFCVKGQPVAPSPFLKNQGWNYWLKRCVEALDFKKSKLPLLRAEAKDTIQQSNIFFGAQ